MEKSISRNIKFSITINRSKRKVKKTFDTSISKLNDSIALSWKVLKENAGQGNSSKNDEELIKVKTECKVLQTNELFIKIFHASPDAFIISKLSDGKILEINRSTETLFEYSKDEMIGRTSAELGLIANMDDREKAVSLLKENGFVRDYTIAVVQKSGEIRQVSLAIEILDVGDEKCMITSVRDITERKKVEEKLKRSTEILNLILDHINEGIIVSEAPDGKAVAISRWGANYTVGRSVDAIINLPVESYLEQWDVRDIYTRAKIQPERLPVYRALRGEVIQGEEILIVQPDGTDFIILANAVPIYNEDKTRIVNVISTWTDITERKKAEEASLARMTELETILDSIADGVLIYDNNGKIVRLNTAADEILKYPQVDREAKLIERVKDRYGVWAEDGRKLTPEEMPAMRASVYGETVKGVLVRVQGAGEPRWVVASAAPLFVSGRQIGAVASLTDITERKKAEEALKESEHRFRTLVTASSEVLYRMSPDWSEMTQLIGRGFLVDTENPNPNWLQEYIHPDDQHQVMTVINKAIRNKSTFELEHRVRQLNGGWGWTYSRAVPLMDTNGKIIEWFGAATDFTKRKQVEEALRTSEAQLDAFFANSPAILNLVDGNFCYINTDKLTPTYYGLNRETIRGKCVQDLSPDFIEQTGGVIRRVIETGEPVLNAQFQAPVPGRGGEMTYWSTSFFRVPLGNEKWGVGVISSEITDIISAETKLRESEERLRFVVENSPDNIFIQDIDLRYVWVGRPAYPLTNDEYLGRTDWDLTPPENAAKLTEIKKKVIGTGQRLTVEIPFTLKGLNLIFEATYEPWRDAKGSIIGVAGYIRDITERKNAVEEVRKAKEQYDLLFNSINEGFAHYKAVYDENGRLYDLLVLEINPAGAEFSGVKRQDQIGRTWKQVWTGIEDSLFDNYRKVDRTDEPFIFEHYSGITKRWYLTRIYKIASGQFAVTFFDITERKLAEEALNESQAKLLDAQKLARFGNYTLDIKTGEIQWSDQMYDLWEVDRSKTIPSFEDLFNLIHPDDKEYLIKTLSNEVRENDRVETEFRILFPGNRIKYVHLITRGIFDESGNLVKRQGVEVDITEIKEAMLKLERTLKELELSNRDIEQYAYVTSHDLKEPVRMVTSYTQLLQKKYKNKLGPNADVYLNFIHEGASRLSLLINDLVNYLQIGTTERNFVPVDINKIINEVLVTLNKIIKESRTFIKYNELPVITADPKQMKQLFNNLIDNAIKFRSNNEPVIEINGWEDEKEWVFSIKDNGIGFKQEYREIIFSVFQRLNSREDYPGNGVGLAICKRIIGHHNGRIWSESEPGIGSIFYFTIPKT